MHSLIYKMGFEKGRAKGVEFVMQLFARRLGRLLVPSERVELVQRLGTLGPDRVIDVALDLSPEALTAWLADPAAT